MRYTYKIIRSQRKTIGLEIRPDGVLWVRAPQRMCVQDIQLFLHEKQAWIQHHMERVRQNPLLPPFAPEELQNLAWQAREVIPARAEALAERMGVHYGRIAIRHQVSRWGSCSGKGNLNFNCLLMLCPEKVLDYVVIHELCHLRHMNHSAAFWREVACYCPDYREHLLWLREKGTSLIQRLRQE